MSGDRGQSYEVAAPAGASETAASGEKRVALVIGNGAYRHTTVLPNPTNDARAVASKLVALGFDVVGGAQDGIDLDYGAMAARIRDFGRRLRDDVATALIFYAGHGIQVGDRNYLVPVDAALDVPADVGSELFELQLLLNQMERPRRTSIVLLDACRNNPLANNLARAMGLADTRSAGITEGLVEQKIAAGTLIAYATQPGHVAFDGDGENGFFTEALLDHIERPGQDVELMLRDVRGRVITATQAKRKGPQVPWVHSSLLGAFYFKPALVKQPVQHGTPSPGGTLLSDAAAAWPEVRDSRDPVRLARFEQHFAGTWFAGEARALREEIESAERQRADADARTKAVAIEREEMSWSWAEHEESLEAYERFLTEWPAGNFAQSARERIAALAVDANGLGTRTEPEISAKGEIAAPTTSNTAAEIIYDVDEQWEVRFPAAMDWFMRKQCLGPDQVENMAATPGGEVEARPVTRTETRTRFFDVVHREGTNDRTILCVPGESIKDAPFAPVMVPVSPGKYNQGNETEPVDGDNRREVTIGYPLLIGKYPVTFDEWDAAVKAGGVLHKPGDQGWGRGKRPVINVSWDDAKAYVAWLSEATGKSYRLLSEAEWEYACRAGTETAYSFGDAISKNQAQFSEGSWGSAKQTVEVGSFPANPFGLHDMHGNVWEWCEDGWAHSYTGAPADGSARTQGVDTTSRVVRGGSWDNRPRFLHSAIRLMHSPDDRNCGQGFRVARSVSE